MFTVINSKVNCYFYKGSFGTVVLCMARLKQYIFLLSFLSLFLLPSSVLYSDVMSCILMDPGRLVAIRDPTVRLSMLVDSIFPSLTIIVRTSAFTSA